MSLIAKLREEREKLATRLAEFDAELASLEGDAGPQGMSFAEFMAARLPEESWMIRGVLPVQSIGMVSALPGVGKTTLLVQIGLSLSAGLEVLGLGAVTRTPVLHVAYEGSPAMFRDRVKQTAQQIPARTGDYSWHVEPPSATLHRIGSPGLDALIKRSGAGLVILDTLGYAADYDENDARDWKRKVMGPLREAVARHGCSFCLVHHPKKDNPQDTGKGTASMRGDVDYLLRLVRDGEGQEELAVENQKLVMDKQKYAPSGWAAKLEYDKVLAHFRRVM